MVTNIRYTIIKRPTVRVLKKKLLQQTNLIRLLGELRATMSQSEVTC